MDHYEVRKTYSLIEPSSFSVTFGAVPDGVSRSVFYSLAIWTWAIVFPLVAEPIMASTLS